LYLAYFYQFNASRVFNASYTQLVGEFSSYF